VCTAVSYAFHLAHLYWSDGARVVDRVVESNGLQPAILFALLAIVSKLRILLREFLNHNPPA
jgi:hypothetical protein